MPEVLEAKRKEEAKVGLWAPSEVDKGTSRNAFLCCNESSGLKCEPFPRCCDCKYQQQKWQDNSKVHDSYPERQPTNIPIVELLHN